MKIKYPALTITLLSVLVLGVVVTVLHESRSSGDNSLIPGESKNQVALGTSAISKEQSGDAAHIKNDGLNDSRENPVSSRIKIKVPRSGKSVATTGASSAAHAKPAANQRASGAAASDMTLRPGGAAPAGADRNEQRRSQLESRFGSFFENNSISAEEQKLVIDAFAAQIAAYSDFRQSGSYNRDTARTFMSGQMAQLRETLTPVLGDATYEALLYHHLSAPARETVVAMASEMSAAGSDLSAETSEKLVSLLHDNRIITFPAAIKAVSPSSARYEALKMARDEGMVMTKAAELLNQQQMDVLQQYWHNYLSGKLTDEERANPREALDKMQLKASAEKQ